jgi:NADP-dependent 3-hydroxy acid dehydrogenase YdfG
MAKLNSGKAVVTGAGSGIGKAIARALVDRGASVVLADIDGEAALDLAGELGPRTMALQLDVTDHSAVDQILASIPTAFRPIDILINNAGHDVGGRTHFARGSADDWTSIIDTNLTGMMRVTRAVLPEMVERNSGDIVNMSSISALRLVPDTAAYTTSKAGVRAFSVHCARISPRHQSASPRCFPASRVPTLCLSAIAATARSNRRISIRPASRSIPRTSHAPLDLRSNNLRICKSRSSTSCRSIDGERHFRRSELRQRR